MKKIAVCFCVCACLIFIGVTGEAIGADMKFPDRPIKLYVGWGAGGGTCMMSRIVSQKAGEILGVSVIVVPKPGAGGTIASDFVARSKPDGYTLGVTTSANNLSALILPPPVSYTNDDFEFFGMFATNPMILFVSSNSPWKTLDELVNYAKAHPGQLKYPSAGAGTSVHTVVEILNKAANIETVHVPMKSGPQMLAAVMGGHCDFSVGFMTTVASAREGGRIRFLATATEKRVSWFPDTATFAELGYPTAVLTPWYAIGGPKGMPNEVSKKLRDAFAVAFQDKEIGQMLKKIGVDPTYMPAEEFSRFIESEETRIRDLYKKAGLEVLP